MKCEFCQGTGITKSYTFTEIARVPCPECQGTGIADCCNGMTADQCVDNEASDSRAGGDSHD